jgi:YjbE family integral membrane protein
MTNELIFFIKAFQITLLDLALCGDNIGIIALATRNLPKKYAKTAGLIGISGAIILRIYFAACLSVFLKIKWLPIKLVGGILLIKITLDLIKPNTVDGDHRVNVAERFWDAVIIVIIADISMSLDNVLAIAGTADGNIPLLAFGIFINIPIIFLGSQLVVDLMRKYPFIIYIGGAILAHTSISMIVKDYLFIRYIKPPYSFTFIMPWAAGILTLLYGVYIVKMKKNSENLHNHNIKRVS